MSGCMDVSISERESRARVASQETRIDDDDVRRKLGR